MDVFSGRVSGVFLIVLVTVFIKSSFAANTDLYDLLNKLYVKYGPHGQTDTSFYEMPRKLEDPEYASNKFEKVAVNIQDRSTNVHCPGGDSRMCLVMNSFGVTVGVMVSITDKEAKESRFPPLAIFSEMPQVFPQELLGVQVHSCIMYFSPKDKRCKLCTLTENTPTAPEGLFIWQKNGELRIPLESSELEKLGFCKQGCYPAMGLHHTKNLCPNKTECEDLMPFHILSSPTSKKVTGFSFYTFGYNIELGRWIEPYNVTGFKISIPNAQQCLYDFANLFYINNVHFYLGQRPWETLPC